MKARWVVNMLMPVSDHRRASSCFAQSSSRPEIVYVCLRACSRCPILFVLSAFIRRAGSSSLSFGARADADRKTECPLAFAAGLIQAYGGNRRSELSCCGLALPHHRTLARHRADGVRPMRWQMISPAPWSGTQTVVRQGLVPRARSLQTTA